MQQSNEQPLTVSALNNYLAYKFDADPYLQQVAVVGEISSFKPRRQTQYFTLKDENATISVLMFASDFRKLDFELEDGMKVIVIGRVDYYGPRGQLSLKAHTIRLDGTGALFQKFEQLKRALQKEGLFAQEHKQPIPQYCRRVAVITSRDGAVIKDVITTTRQHNPLVQLVLFPAVVQGNQAAPSLVARLREVNERGDFDAIIIGRGGGSLEDLWAFNEEEVVRAIYASRIPVISSVGHEPDTTLADFVADKRAATPTAAAVCVATPDLVTIKAEVVEAQARLQTAITNYLHQAQGAVDELTNTYILRTPERLYSDAEQTLAYAGEQLDKAIAQVVTQRNQQLQMQVARLKQQSPLYKVNLAQQRVAATRQQLQTHFGNYWNGRVTYFKQTVNNLALLSPLNVLTRGYAFVTAASGTETKYISDVNQVKAGNSVQLHVANGQIDAEVTAVHPEKKQ